MALDAETRDQLVDTVRRFVTERLRPGQTVNVRIARGGTRLTVPVTLVNRPADPDSGR